MQTFLLSEKSPFGVRTVQDFVETLDILGFSRGASPERYENRHTVFRFFNSHFKRGQPVRDDLYKLKSDRSQGGVKNAKRMLSTHSIKFLQTLLEKYKAPPLKITKLDLAHMKLQFALEKQLDTLAQDAAVIEYSVVDPADVKIKEIAGYYGELSLDALKFGFQNYFPIYNPLMDLPEVPQVSAAPTGLVWEMPTEPQQVDQTVPVKKFYSKQRREESKENERALAFLHQESMSLGQLTEE